MKILGWFSKLLLSAILISTISVVTTAFVVNTYITQLLKPLNLQLSQNPLKLSDLLVNLMGSSNILGQEGNAQEATAADDDAEKESESASTSQVGKEDSVAAWAQTGTSTGTDSARAADKAMVMSEEQFQSKREQLSNEDKRVIFAALSQLPEADMQTISTLVEDGITSAELAEVEKIVEQHLKPDEYKQLLEILQKYN